MTSLYQVKEVKSFDCCGDWLVIVDNDEIVSRVKEANAEISSNVYIQGLTDTKMQAIVIDHNASHDQQRHTLFHELFHVIYAAIGGLRLPVVTKKGNDVEEDDVICQIAPLLLDTLRRNGPLVAALLSGSEAEYFIKELDNGNEHATSKEGTASRNGAGLGLDEGRSVKDYPWPPTIPISRYWSSSDDKQTKPKADPRTNQYIRRPGKARRTEELE
jgi:hypothetical protein